MSKKWSMWRDPNIYIGIAVAAIVVPSLIYAIVTHVRRGDVNEDFIYVDISGEKTMLTLARPPLAGEVVWDVIADNTIDEDILKLAVNRWEKKVGHGVFRTRVSQEFFDHPMFMMAGDPTVKQAAAYRAGTVALSVKTVGGKEGCGGLTNHNYDLKTGRVHWVDISINPMYTYDKRSYEAALVHELGHALLLGHADHRTSIMRKKLNDRGIITEHSTELVRKLWMQ